MAGLFSLAPVMLGIAQTGIGAYQQIQQMQHQRAQAEYQQRWQIWRQQQADREVRLQEQRVTAAEDAEIDRMTAAAARQADQRRQALRRVIARQRARLGARGIGSTTGGSGEALLLGLVDEAAMAQAADDRDLRSRVDAITADRHYRRTRNLLDRRHPAPVAPTRPSPGLAPIALDTATRLTSAAARIGV